MLSVRSVVKVFHVLPNVFSSRFVTVNHSGAFQGAPARARRLQAAYSRLRELSTTNSHHREHRDHGI